jgi:hypothetical protein
MVPVIEAFLPVKFRWLLGVFPTSWVPRGIIANSVSGFLLILVFGFVVHAVYLYFLTKRFIKKA